MEGVSEGENQNNNDSSNNNHNHTPNNNNGGSKGNNSNEGHSKPKRQMKTPFQLETLEKAYALEAYPSESIRAELSEKLGLSDRQLQMWFCHRRLKDKKDGGPAKKPRKMVPALPESPIDELRAGPPELGSDYGSGSGSGSSPFGPAELRNVVSRGLADDLPPMGRRYYEPRQSMLELRAIAIVEAQLGKPLREDGPVLGIEFDTLPPDAFGAPLVAEQQKRSGHPFEGKSYERHEKLNKATARTLHEYPFLPEPSTSRTDVYGHVAPSHIHNSALDGPTARSSSFAVSNEQLPRIHGNQGHASRVRLSQQDKQGVSFPLPPVDDNCLPQKDPFTNTKVNSQISEHPVISPENSYMLSDGQILANDTVLRLERKRKCEEARIAKEVEAHEIRIRKELEKQDNLRRKHEERLRKEMERQDRERRKEEERLMREKQREEDRLRREQRREMERREKFLQKECLRAEKRRLKEELRKEREAVRRKAAIEKATARKIARESMELIEDEQLELMEMAVSRKGLSSIISLDHDTMQNLESFRDFLGAFPPKSVQLKSPFAVQPWINLEENIGNLLMVWRFFITFADVLELWPFTLDEFVQAFHDYDSRLLGEIHVALLKLIIKDIEDVARTPSSGLGMSQNGAANPGGGHPEIVGGAYTWGFDIRNWQQHLNPLTWPEIFRQLALSAGFGPQLKKRSMAWSYLPDNNEGKSSEDAISTLRSGSAAENAFAIMQEKGLLLPRRSRHRLTPGTVKFAAFHVLSLEGSKGLTVLELADKIQKSGLRDLTTSKTPEASISVALTRDTKLFERIAPSTYRVRAAYRKDPADAEAILSAARKKVQIFENGFLAAEDADEVERDEDSECDDVDEDPEVDDLATPSSANIVTENYNEVNPCSRSGKENLCDDVALDLQNEFDKDSASIPLSDSKDVNCPSALPEQFVASEDAGGGNPDEENMEIDESKSGESWIQGLTEGEYSDLSVEERLNALVALVGIANEGNSIRVVLEDRLEAANALKKQMWAEAQLDKSRLKEENITKLDFPSFVGGKTEMHLARSAAEGSQSPLPDINNRNTDLSPSVAESKKSVHDLNSVQNDLNSLPTEKTLVAQDFSTGPDNFLAQQLAFASKRSRSQLKSYIAHRAEEMYVYRSLPLGQDRRRNRYWQFVASASSNDPGSGRIFVELHDGNWRLIDTEEAFDALLMSLDTRGIRESHLRLMLQKIETSFRSVQSSSITGRGLSIVKRETDETSPDSRANFDSPGSTICGLNSDSDLVETSSSFRIELGRNETEKKAALRRYQDFQKWMLEECKNSSTLHAMKCGKMRCRQRLEICDFYLGLYSLEDSHCFSCHQTFSNSGNDLSRHAIQCKERSKSDFVDTSFPFGMRLLKALLALIEVSVPQEALQSFWMGDRGKTWGVKLNASSSSEQLLQILTLFESVIKQDFLSSNYSTTEELLGPCNQSGTSLHNISDPASVPVLPWIPQTIAAVALRLFDLDASIAYVPEEKPEPIEDKDKELGEYIKLPTRFAPSRNDKEIELTELNYNAHVKEENRSQLKSSRNNYKRGRGAREQGRSKKLQRRVNGSKPGASRRNAMVNDNVIEGLRQPGRKALKQGGVRGRRTVRKRRTGNKKVEETLPVHMPDIPSSPESGGESPRILAEEWDDDNVNATPTKDDDNIVGEEEAMESDDNAQEEEYEQENWEVGYNGVSNKWNEGRMMEASDEDVDAYDEDDNGMEGVGDGESEGDVDVSEESDDMPNRIENDQGSDSEVSDDYSD
ncbi:homeobox-DDT domain protein RLT1 isoform X2 [Morus notabilis]|uniref:homeobox-DDT domain protein RLT1 isoform X2 n=1 Tax=Morus notabilis TaxID=981085 RepID=UPI000CED1A4F|nr:homeobox-DDT domain protein RLT1 isoform X2 [Morus notabilis]